MDLNRGLPMVAAGALVVGAASGGTEAEDRGGFCVFRRCTGGYCPGCGGTRAAWALVRGRFDEAWSFHPWIPLLALQLVVASGIAVTLRLRKTEAAVPSSELGERRQRVVVAVLVANLALGIGIWALRLGSGAIPAPFG